MQRGPGVSGHDEEAPIAPPLAEFHTVPALARMAKKAVSKQRMRKAIRDGSLPAYRHGGSWPRVSWSDFCTWLRSTRVQPTVTSAAHAQARAAEILERESEGCNG
jgi:hypothetical protein